MKGELKTGINKESSLLFPFFIVLSYCHFLISFLDSVMYFYLLYQFLIVISHCYLLISCFIFIMFLFLLFTSYTQFLLSFLILFITS